MHFISIFVFLSLLRCLEFNQIACKIKSIARVVDCSNLGLVEFQLSMTPPHVRGSGYMLDLSGNMINIVDISDLLSQFNTVDLRDNPCCYTLYPVWSGCIITGSNNNSISTMLVVFITNTLLIVASCFPYIVEYVGEINAYYVRAVRWTTLIRHIQRQARARLFRPYEEAAQAALQPLEAIPEPAEEAAQHQIVQQQRRQQNDEQQEPYEEGAPQQEEARVLAVAAPRRRVAHAQHNERGGELERRPRRQAAIRAQLRMRYMQ